MSRNETSRNSKVLPFLITTYELRGPSPPQADRGDMPKNDLCGPMLLCGFQWKNFLIINHYFLFTACTFSLNPNANISVTTTANRSGMSQKVCHCAAVALSPLIMLLKIKPAESVPSPCPTP